jgi:hypothetical protein
MRYWDNTGKYEAEAEQLQELVPAMGESATFKGEVWRATTKIYWDYFNNGFGNNWEQAAAFLMDHVALPASVRAMCYECARGNMGNDQYEVEIELMVDTVIEALRDIEDRPNSQDMWLWPVSYKHKFEDVNYDDDEEDEYYDEEEDAVYGY